MVIERSLILERHPVAGALAAFGIVLAYVAIAARAAATKSPWCDEAWFASPAFNLFTNGFMGTTVIEPAGTWLFGIDRYTFWIPPNYLLAQAGWYEIFGFSLFSMRMMSVAFGVISLVSWFAVVRTLSDSTRVALLALTLIAFDYCFIMTASVGRMDMMSAALGASALAAYLCLRERNYSLAVLVSALLTAVNVFTHPTGILAFAGLTFLAIYLDRTRITLKILVIGAGPFIVGGLLWGLYIAEAPSLFFSQFGGNVNGIHGAERLSGLGSLVTNAQREITERYLEFYGLGAESNGPARLKILILVAYAAGIAAAVVSKEIRARRGYRVILLLTGIYFVMLLVLDGHKQVMYLIHIVPMFAVILAISIHHYFSRFRALRFVLAPAVAALIALQLGGVFYIIRKNDYENKYLAAIDVLNSYRESDPGLVMASGETAFGTGFSENIVDDWRLGFYSGKKANFIVIGKQYEGMMNDLRTWEPVVYEHVVRVLDADYDEVHNDGHVKILRRRD